MRAVLQRVKAASVEVEGRTVGRIDSGLLVLLGIARTDRQVDADYVLDKTVSLRIFPDEQGKMNRSVSEAGGALLIVSQFTLYADCKKGRRPSFDRAAGGEQARSLYDYFVTAARATGLPVETGVFQAFMNVHSINDGPVTIICDSPEAPGFKIT